MNIRFYTDFFRKAGVAVMMAGLIPFAAGCSLDQDTAIAMSPPAKIQLEKNQYSEAVETAKLDQRGLRAVADYYRDHGNSPVNVAVTYDPRSRVNTARKASTRAADLATFLRKENIPVAQVDVLPVHGQGDVSQTLFEYVAVFAKEPEDCESMGGVDGNPTTFNKDYGIGCTIKTQMARQIARPADMLGREGVKSGDGRRLGNIVDAYRTGEPLAPLDGETVTGGD